MSKSSTYRVCVNEDSSVKVERVVVDEYMKYEKVDADEIIDLGRKIENYAWESGNNE